MARFITNQDKLFSELLETYIPHSKQLDFLVGYFYFSGFYRIYKEIGERKLRILVGMEADVTVNHAIREWADLDSDKPSAGLSRLKTRQVFQETTKNIINQADIPDTNRRTGQCKGGRLLGRWYGDRS
jgi:hypothetical protein